MQRSTRMFGAVMATAALLALTAACGSDDDGSDAAATPAASMSDSMDENMSGSMSQPFGTACADVPADGAGSFSGMAEDPVATAASNNPALSTLVTAVSEAGLVDTLNSSEGITVFAPANPAFEAIPAKDLQALLKDKDALTSVLTYHVVEGELSPEQLAGEHETLAGESLEVTGSGEDFTVNGSAMVVCGNVQTANATVYIIDGVLSPTS